MIRQSFGHANPQPCPSRSLESLSLARLWFSCRKHAAINPGSACSRTVILEIFDVLKLLSARERETVDFPQHFFDIGLRVLAFGSVVPGQRLKSIIAWASIFHRLLLQEPAKMIDEPRVAACLAGRIYGFCTKLKQPLRVGKCSGFLSRAGSRKKKNLGFDFSGYSSPLSTSGDAYQHEAVSVSTMSRTTSHFSLDIALRSSRPLEAPTAGF